jgi:hypothetical protein
VQIYSNPASTSSAASSVVFAVKELSVQCLEKRMWICAAMKITRRLERMFITVEDVQTQSKCEGVLRFILGLF